MNKCILGFKIFTRTKDKSSKWALAYYELELNTRRISQIINQDYLVVIVPEAK